MPIFDIFSKRQKRLREADPDVYVYDHLPTELRVQIVHIMNDTLGTGEDARRHENVVAAYRFITNSLCREYGTFFLPGTPQGQSVRYCDEELKRFVLNEKDAERVLDAVEQAFKVVNTHVRSFDYMHKGYSNEIAEGGIQELNARFRQHAVGYAFENNEIFRVDSELVHEEIVKPALSVLREKQFAGVQDEYLKAHEHYRHGRTKEALAESLKAFESMMKAICTRRSWYFDANATASKLIQICVDNGLIPSFWLSHFNSLQSSLASGVPTARNKLGGHGQGGVPIEVPSRFAAYLLHQTAATIVFLQKCDADLK